MLCSLRAPAALTTTAGRRHLLRGSVEKESASSQEPWDLIQMQGRLFGLMAIGKKASKQMDHINGHVIVFTMCYTLASQKGMGLLKN